MLSQTPTDCAVVVSSCDSYSDIWEPFFTLFHKYWSDNPYPVYVNTETLDCKNDYVSITSLKSNSKDISWTRRLKEALERVDAEYIVFMLDDFFLYDFVDTASIERCLSYMRKDSEIGAIFLVDLGYEAEESNLLGLEKISAVRNNTPNLILGLWRRSVFLEYLVHDEGAWEFEAKAPKRSLERSETFYSFSKNTRLPIPYKFTEYGLFAGKWFRATVELFKEHGITHDFTARGFYDEYLIGTIPYCSNQIKTDSYLVSCYGLTRDNPRIDTDNILYEGHFTQRYDTDGSIGASIWYVSSWHGYIIEDFKCTITFKNGSIEILGASDAYGNFVLHNGAMYCLWPGVFAYILPKSKGVISNIVIEGRLNKNLDVDDLKTAYSKDVRVAPSGVSGLLNSSQVYAERLLVAENFKHFRFYSSLRFKRGIKFDEQDVIYDGKDRFPGKFIQTYAINKSAENVLRWDIGENVTGFALGDLTLDCLYDDEVEHTSIEIKGNNGVLSKGYWVFLSSPSYMEFQLPTPLPDKIRVGGTVLAPIPRKVLSCIVYGEDAEESGEMAATQDIDTLLRPNSFVFVLSMIKRAVKKYGLIVVVKEGLKRIFRR